MAMTIDSDLDDPRIDGSLLRCVPATDRLGSVLLVGVVHDHPASIFRVTRVVEAVSPDVLAVELPPLATPLFQLYGSDRHVPPRLGGEMSAAIQAAAGAKTVGIDAPNLAYLKLLFRSLYAERVSIDVGRSVLRDLVSSSAHAIACRLGAVIGAVTPLRLRLYSPISYDSSLLDSPAAQAEHETRHLTQRQSFLRAIETPLPIELVDTAREGGMVIRLTDLRESGDIVAVVGMEHLDRVYTQLVESS